MIDDWYINNLTKNQVSAVFIRSLFEEVCHPNLLRFVWRHHVSVSFEWAQTGGGAHKRGLKATETSVIEFCC